MAVRQLNVFVENKSGAVAQITELLSANQIDIRAMVLADTPDHGILRLIVSDTDKAVAVLEAEHIITKVIGITIVRIKNEHGGLSRVLAILRDNNISIEYMYAFVAVSGEEAFAALRFENKEAALHVLNEHNVPILHSEME